MGIAVRTLATLMEPLDRDIAAQESIVKVVATESGKALYFSRAPIPGHRQGTLAAPMYRHVGLYAYRVGFLKKFVTWPLTAMEQSEVIRAAASAWRMMHIYRSRWRPIPRQLALILRQT